MTVTARATIQGALKLIGVLDPAETMTPEDSDDGLLFLNNMVDAWNTERLNIYAIDNIVASFSGASATIGPSMTFNTPRPIRIESGYYTIGGVDYQLDIVDDSIYNSISIKTIATGYPEILYYTGDAPTGQVIVYPITTTSTQYTLQVMSQLVAFADLDTAYNLPPGYAKALMYALAIELAPLYKMEASATVVRVFMVTKRALKRANVVVPTLCVSLPGNTTLQSGSTNLIRIMSGA